MDPHHVDADPDFLFDADADPAFHPDADAAGSDFSLDGVLDPVFVRIRIRPKW